MQNPFDELHKQISQLEGMISQLLSQKAESSNQVSVHNPLDVKGASTILGIAIGTIYQNIEVIPHYKKHGRLYFFENELLDYLKSKPNKKVIPIKQTRRTRKARAA
ncbi:hypothetical protein GCM10028808_60640 [Spirosoma migulaei]